jgi:iron complex transport system substrate-binding protein
MNKLKYLLSISIALIFLQSCNNVSDKRDIDDYFSKAIDSLNLKSETQYASGFEIYNFNNITKVVVKNPQKDNTIFSEYYLVTDKKTKESFNENRNIIITPLNRVAIFSGTQLSALIETGLSKKVVGVSEADYIIDTNIRKMVAEGEIKELASNGEFYLETVLKVNPEIIFHSPYKANESHPLAATNITMIPFFDFKESSPLGRAEWIKFSLAFFGKSQIADSIFENIVGEYDKYLKLVSNIEKRPTVFCDKYFNGQWYVPGGKSYVATLLNDAGADYLWKSDKGLVSFPLDYEVVYQKAVHADFWRIVGSFNDVGSYQYLKMENELYAHFDAFKNKKVIWCDAKKSSYFEKGSLQPHILLADLIHCFHPELLPNYKPAYYKLMR